MADHRIEVQAECDECQGTGLYVGMGESDGAAVVCFRCKGTGKRTLIVTYKDFEGRRQRDGVRRVFQCNPGIGIGETHGEKGRQLMLEDFGGMNYHDWLHGEPFPPKSEMRNYVCPRWWLQCAESKTLYWEECNCSLGSRFSDCTRFKNRSLCWMKYDREQAAATRGKGR